MREPTAIPATPLRAAGALILGLALAATARADCVDGVRATTAAELDFNARAHAALVALLPAAPPNTAMRGAAPDPSKPDRTPSFCKGQREGAFEVLVGKGYLYTWPRADADRMGAERKQLLDQVKALEALPAEQAATYNTLVQQSREAYNSQPRAKRGGPPLSEADQQLAARKVAEGKALDDQAQALQKSHLDRVAPEVGALRAKADALQTHPQELVVQLRVNAARLDVAGDTRRAQWRTHGEPHAGGLVVRNVTVVVGGPEGAARQRLWDALDHTRIQALVGAPLPSVAESSARAAAQPAAAIAAPVTAPSPSPSPAPVARTAPAPEPATAASAPAQTAVRKDEPRPADAPAVARDAVNTVNKLKGLLGR